MSDTAVKTGESIELGSIPLADTNTSSAARGEREKFVPSRSATPHLPNSFHDGGPTTHPDAAKTAAILAKLDQRIVPITVLLYGSSFIDRAAIGYARSVGLMKDLHLTDEEYALDVSIFFVAYVIFEVPSNVGLRYFGARRWLSGVALCWGICQLCTGFVRSHAELAVVRTLMGAFEAGILPGITTAMSFVYPASTIQARFGALIALNVLFGVFAGLLAYAIAHVKSTSFEGWRYLFIIEGIFTIAVAGVAYFVLISSMDEAKFLDEDEKRYLQDRLEWDCGRREFAEVGAVRKRQIMLAFADTKVWILALVFFGISGPSYSIGLALPSLLKLKMHHNTIDSQLLTIPVFAVGAVFIFLASWLSDRYTKRALVLVVSASASALGWIIGYATSSSGVQYFALFIAFSGSASAIPSCIALASQNLAGKTKRAAGLAIVISVGGTASILAANTAPNKDAPRFALAYRLNIALSLLAVGATVVEVIWLKRENRAKSKARDALADIAARQQEEQILDDSNIFFTYRF